MGSRAGRERSAVAAAFSPRLGALELERPAHAGRLLDIDVPVICAVNGPALKHADLCFLCDIILCADHAEFQDGHMFCDTVPGDGAHVIYPAIMGPIARAISCC